MCNRAAWQPCPFTWWASPGGQGALVPRACGMGAGCAGGFCPPSRWAAPRPGCSEAVLAVLGQPAVEVLTIDSRWLSGLLSRLPLTGRIQATGGGGGGGGGGSSVLESRGNSQPLERGPARPGVGGTASMSMGSSHCCPARSQGPSLCTSAVRGLEGGGRRCVRKVRGGAVESGWC